MRSGEGGATRAHDGGRPPVRDLTDSAIVRSQRAEKRLTFWMIGLAVLALAALLTDYGTGPTVLRPLWRQIETACTALFILLQCLKPAVVARPLDYVWRHRLDYALIAILIFGLLSASALRHSPEFRYLVGHGAGEPLEALPVLAIQGYLVFLLVLKSPWFQRALLALPLGSATALWTSFAALIAVGTILLRLPGAAAAGEPKTWIEALFTATSAACVTGLIVVDTGSHWSGFGQAVILALIQIGGLGVLTMTGSVALLAGEALTGPEQRGLAELAETDALPQIRRALVRPLVFTLIIEGLGAAFLFWRWRDPALDTGRQIWVALFHSVSAFCNAGFSLFADSLGRFRSDAATLLAMALLIVLGGIGFGVLRDLARAAGRLLLFRRPGPLEPQTRMAVALAGILIAGGGLGLWLLESGASLSACPRGTRLLNALFLSVSARTAGFQTTDLAGMTIAGSALTVVLMLIGGAPGGTAGGMKTTTVWVLLDRRLPGTLRRRGLAVSLAVIACFLASALLTHRVASEAADWLVFESASAIGTVGLSRGATPLLPDAARLVLVGAMLFGRLGPFVIAFSLRRRARRAGVRVDEEAYLLG
jgi:trk system potassium uptake protein TrkH